MSEEKVDGHVHAELLALQSLAATDIAFYKQQQWHATNYGLLLYAALVGASRLVASPVTVNEKVFLAVLATSVLLVGLFVIHDLDLSLAKSRDRLPAARKHFDREISLRAYARGGDPDEALAKSVDKPSLRWLFQLTLLVGFALTIWVLLRS